MKLLAIPFLILISAFSLSAQKLELRAISFNIRYDSPKDAEEGNGWERRKPRVADLIRFHQPDVVGMQEVLKHQAEYLDEALPNYGWVGVGRDNGKTKGEYSPVFYRKDKFELIETETFWLAERTDKPGKSWDAALPRIMTWAKLKVIESDEEFFVFNTHFDHVGEIARVESAKLIAKKVGEIAGDSPFVITGDFNCSPVSDPFESLVASSLIMDSFLNSEAIPYGPEGSFCGSFEAGKENQERIDHIFVRSGTKVIKCAVLTDNYRGKYPSDHLPVLADIEF